MSTMRYSGLFAFVVFLQLSLHMAQPIIKTEWTQVNEGTASPFVSGRTEPRVATFSDGRYIIVYPIQNANTFYTVVGKIFNSDGSVFKAEFSLADPALPSDNLQAPNVVVFEDDTFLVVWRIVNVEPKIIRARRFDAAGNALGASFDAFDTSYYSTAFGPIEVVATRLRGFAVSYPADSNGCIGMAIGQFDGNNNLIFTACYASGELVDPKSALVFDRTTSNIYYSHETDSGGLIVGGVGSDNLNRANRFSFTLPNPNTPLQPSLVLNQWDALTVFWTGNGGSLHSTTAILPLPAPGSVSTNTFKEDMLSLRYSNARSVAVSDIRTLVAYQSNNINTNAKYINYQLVNYERSGGQILVNLEGEEYTVASNLAGLNMVALPRSSDILVVAKDSVTSNVMQQRLSFCGNNRLDVNEQCDGTENCDENCRCLTGFYAYKGVCTFPNVEPSLDCLEVRENGYLLYFSFNNQDDVEHNIEYGMVNNFVPNAFATDRPTQYPRGQSLLFPVSPYTTSVDFSAISVSWQLGSYNLTVDLTDASLICPNSTSFVIYVASKTNTSNAAQIVQNFATKYNVDINRLSYSIVYVFDTVPHRYIIRITIASTTTQGQPSTAQVLGTLFNDYKNITNRPQIESDLLNGITDTAIKDLFPNPIDTQVRPSRADPQEISPESQSPSGGGNGPNSNPSNNSPSSPRAPGSQITAGASGLSHSYGLAVLIFGYLGLM